MDTIAQSPGRIIKNFNTGWTFSKDTNGLSGTQWQRVQLPHTWNIEDVMDDVPGYYRGVGWYKKNFVADRSQVGKQLYFFFEGANQVTEVFINGIKAGNHIGGYGGFYVPVTPFTNPRGSNTILVKVDNSHNQDIAPLSADFTFYGGIYRDVWMIATNAVHFSSSKGGSGVFVSTPEVDSQSATLGVRAVIRNSHPQRKQIKVSIQLKDRKGKIAGSISQLYWLRGNQDTIFHLPAIQLKKPELWSPESPTLYSVVSEIKDASTGLILDAITTRTGFRWFRFDAQKGFFLNNKPYKLVGASRHQDYKGFGNAVPDSLAIQDIVLLKEMGGNFLRVAHYPQDPSILQACDSLGILASVEIPLVNEITETPAFAANCMNMQSEMIRQHYNHTSVIIWCYMNEVLLRPHYTNDQARQQLYTRSITRLAEQLDSLTRAEDPSRYTMIAHHGDYKKYRDAGLIDIPMVVGWNLYSGWYGPKLEDFPVFLDAFHADYPGKPMVVSEYGADADPRISSTQPIRFDKSVEYTTRLHQYYMAEMLKRPFVAGAMIWNLADFNSETRAESMPHINNKGLLEWDRTAKAPYYYYKAILSKAPFVKIITTQPGAGVVEDSTGSCSRILQVASNLKEVELFFNGVTIGKSEVVNGIAEWKVLFVNGINTVEARGTNRGSIYSDKLAVPFSLRPNFLTGGNTVFTSLNILLGSRRFFTDASGNTWIPDKEYQKGSWGSIGGAAYKIANNNRLPYGTDKNITGTFDDPIYQTQRTGIEKYRLDVPKGEYEVTFYFAELQGGLVKELPYNLSDPDRIEPKGRRIFNMNVNGKVVLDHFDIAAQYGPATAVTRKITVTVTDSNGIEVIFTPVEGAPVLNALQIVSLKQEQKATLSTR